jgi:hypothetical protein
VDCQTRTSVPTSATRTTARKPFMNKEQLLQIIKLLSALESWGFSNKNMFPDYLHDDLCRTVKMLEAELLK